MGFHAHKIRLSEKRHALAVSRGNARKAAKFYRRIERLKQEEAAVSMARAAGIDSFEMHGRTLSSRLAELP